MQDIIRSSPHKVESARPPPLAPRVPLIHDRRRGFHDSANLNLAKRRLCAALVGTSLGSAAHCCAISVARVRAALTASFPRSNRPLPRRTNFGAAKSCSLVIIFMIRPPTAQSGESNYAHRSRPYHGSRNSGDSAQPVQRGNRYEGQQAPGATPSALRPMFHCRNIGTRVQHQR